LYALGSAAFAGIVSILAKIGIKDTDANLATALRTVIVLAFAWLMVFAVGSQAGIPSLDIKSLVFLVLSGLATGASWLCYFRALQIGDINKVVPVERMSVVLTMLLSFIFLGEGLTLPKVGTMALIGGGTFLMVERKENAAGPAKGRAWLVYTVLSAVFASLTAILAKVGIADVESNLGTAIRTVVVLIMAWVIVFMQKTLRKAKEIDKKSWVFISLSGVATGLSWLCFYRALQEGPASVVVPLDKLSIVVTVAFGFLVFKEKLGRKPLLGLAMILVGTFALLVV
jgi:transporter family protein